MNRRSLALKVAVVGVMAAGVGLVASPAAAMSVDCSRMAYWNERAAMMMNADGNTFAAWNGWYDIWLRTEKYLNENC
jgi:hypothetical protein